MAETEQEGFQTRASFLASLEGPWRFLSDLTSRVRPSPRSSCWGLFSERLM